MGRLPLLGLIIPRAADEARVCPPLGKVCVPILQGVAYDHGEANPGVHTVSVAVFNHLKKPVAALSLCVPANRAPKITDPKNIRLMKKTATMVSGRLFYEAPKK